VFAVCKDGNSRVFDDFLDEFFFAFEFEGGLFEGGDVARDGKDTRDFSLVVFDW